jgi:UDP-N-acetylglucosamine 3-dehydrogenase
MTSIAFLGCGKIAKSHSKLLQSIDSSLPRYYASRSVERAAAFCKDVGGTGSFGTYDAAINSSDVEVVFICTPPDSHLDLARKSLEAGKHVIVEKPPFFSLADFDQVASLASNRNRQLIVAENYFYKPLAVVLRKLLAEEVVGTPLFIHINALKKQKTEDWRNDPDVVGRGALFEGGIHWVNLLANLGFQVESVTGHRPGDPEGLDRSALTVFRFTNNAVATLSYSWEVPTVFQGLRISRIFGTKGSITFETNGLFVIVRGTKKRVILPGLSDISGYRAMLEDFVGSVASGRPPAFSTGLARQDMALLEQAYSTMK